MPCYVEIGTTGLAGNNVHGECFYADELVVSAAVDTTNSAATNVMSASGARLLVARIYADVDCFIALGTSPDPTALVSSTTTQARRLLSAGDVFCTPIKVGESVACKAK